MKKLNISYLIRLRNQQFPEAYGTICSILERNEITEEYVTACFENVKAQRQKLGFLQNMKVKHHLSGTISELNNDRQDYFLSLKGRVASNLRSPNETERKAAKVLDLWLEGYREFLSTPRILEQNLLVDQLSEDIETQARIGTAMREAGVMEIFESIELITADIRTAYLQRSQEKEAQSRKANALRSEAYAAMKTLLNGIGMAIDLKSEDSAMYVGYWNEISTVLDQFNVKTLNRATRKKNATEGKEEPMEDLVDGDKGGEAEGDTPVTRIAPKMTWASTKSKPYGEMSLDGMDVDLQNGAGADENSTSTTNAMSGSVTNGVETNGADKETADAAVTMNAATESTTGNGERPNEAKETTRVDADTTKHNGADVSKMIDSDRES